jgi:dipeptidyl aminopeptidase/acylaminoacyl peptidase
MFTPRIRFALSCAVLAACGGSQSPAPGPIDPGADVDRDPAADESKTPRYTAAQFHQTTSINGASFSHDESKILLSTDETGVFNAYAQPVAGGQRVALTSSTEESIYGLTYFPSDDRFLYASDRGGNELDHVYVRELDGTDKDLTPGDALKAQFAGWSGDRKAFYILTNERDPKAFDLYRYAVKDYQRKRVFENTGAWDVSSISRDGKWVALIKVNNNADSDIFLWNASKPKAKPIHITKHEGMVLHQVEGFTPDDKALLYSTDANGEFAQVWKYDLKSKKHASHVVAHWDVSYVSYSETGKYRVIATNEDAKTVLRIETADGVAVPMPDLPDGEIAGARFSRSETKLAFYVTSNRSSANLYVLDLATGEHRALTDTMNPAIDTDNLVDGEVVRYESFDGKQIPAILYKPVDASPDAKVPATLWIHGGPGGQSRLGYSPTIQHLVNHGYAVLAVNNRGSSGYGKTFFHLDDRNHGDGDLKDCVWGRKYLETLDWIDGDRIAITGGSYGGFMVLAALAFQPEVFDAGVDIFGVSNWYRTISSIPPWWAAFAEALYAEIGDPKTDGERLKKISPLFSADKIVKPLLVIQGANDPRVLKVESDEIVAAVKNNNVPVEYVVFEDEGHGFAKKDNRIAMSEAMVKFLDAHLK